jgi:hypothetical protein
VLEYTTPNHRASKICAIRDRSNWPPKIDKTDILRI